jgi:mxaK protein
MEKRIKRLTAWWLLLVVVGIAGTAYESYRIAQIRQLNHALEAGKSITDARYAYTAKFAAAYQLGRNHDFKHAVQSYGQLLETSPSSAQQARIQYNIGNNLFMSALNRRVNDNGSLIDEALYDITQARVAYEQSLRLDPQSAAARFNLSLLLAVLPQHLKNPQREQSGMELSNLPIGLP